jgi:glycosyltransferase involved in cell wall biosynthesis
MKKLTLIFENFENIHLEKDVGYIPRLLSKQEDLSCEIICYENENNLDIEIIDESVKVKKIRNRYSNTRFYFLSMMFYMIKNARKINNLMLFHINKGNFWYVFFYKLLNPKGFIYIKFDADIRIKNLFEQKPESLREKFYNFRFMSQFNYVLKKANLLSIETKQIQKILLDYKQEISDKLIYLPNGFFVNDLNLKEVKIEHKENIIISIARFGTYQKNTELLLESLAKVEDFQDWKVILIGSIEESFQSYIDDFFKKYPNMKNSIEFIGVIKDKDKIFEYLLKSKVFLLTSRYESFALVLTEAAYFGNYIVSTDVGIASDITNDGKLGKIVDESSNEIAKVLRDIIDTKIDVSLYFDDIIKNSHENFMAEKQIGFLYEELITRGLN